MPGIEYEEAFCNKLFITAEESEKPEKAEIKGNIPSWLEGTYLRVGPGKFDFPNFKMEHWLDGYALISKFQIKGGLVSFEKKYLQSDAYKRAMAAQKPVINELATRAQPDPNKGFFSKIVSSLLPEFTDNAYSTLYQLGKDLFATCDTPYFRRIDPNNLETCDKCDTNKYFGMNGQSAHPMVDENGDTWNIGYTFVTGLKYHFFKIPGSCSSKEMLKKSKIFASIPTRWNGSMATMHSFGMSHNYLIFIEQPFVVSISRIAGSLIKGDTVKDWLEWRPQEKNRFYIVEKSSGKILKSEILSAEAFYYMHMINCYEEDNQLIVDLIAYDSPSMMDTLYMSKLRKDIQEKVDLPSIQRYVLPLYSDISKQPEDVNLITKSIASNATCIRKGSQLVVTPEILSGEGVEMPSMNKRKSGKKYSYVYAAGTFNASTFSNTIVKLDLESKEMLQWRENEFRFPGEPLFVPNPDSNEEDDGIIISGLVDKRPGQDDYLLFLNAKDLKEIGRAKFRSNIPSALHGIFLPA